MTIQDFKIPASNLSKLLHEIEKLSKRAVRLGVVVPVVAIGTEQVETYKDGNGHDKVRVWHPVTLTSEVVKLAGWTFLGTLDHSEGGVILRAVPGVQLPGVYRTAAADCQHCNTARKRTSTFVLLHDDGTYKQVGRQCLADFLGVDPTKAAQSAEYLGIFGELLGGGEDEGWGGGGGGSAHLHLASFLAWVSVSIRLDGWLSRTKAKEFDRPSTVDLALSRIEEFEKNHKGEKPADEDRAAADAAIEWAQALPESGEYLSDYLHNVVVVAKSPAVSYRNLGIAASILPAYDRAQGKAREKKTAVVSQHFGAPKKREEFTLTVVGTHSFEGYGYNTTRWLIRLKDEAGNVATWWTGDEGLHQFHTGFELKEGISRDAIGQTFEVKATVKAHEDYKGTKQTVLTRVVVLDNVTEAQARSFTSGLV